MKKSVKHGHCRGGSITPTYVSWKMMKQRCTNFMREDFQYYGESGLCDEWMDFLSFLIDMGERPGAEYTLGRIDHDKPYCKENCRWETWAEQNAHKSFDPIYTVDGLTLTYTEWAEKLGIKRGTLVKRLHRGFGDVAFRLKSRERRRKYERERDRKHSFVCEQEDK